MNFIQKWLSNKEQKENPTGATHVIGGSQYTPKDYNQHKYAVEGYGYNSIVFSVIDEIARASASIKLKVMDGDKEVDENHELVKLLKNPNPMQSKQDFFQNLLVDYLIYGESFQVGTGIANAQGVPSKTAKPIELWSVNPVFLEIRGSVAGLPTWYDVLNANGSKKSFKFDQLTNQSAINHVKTYNPSNYWRGMSPMAAAGLSVDLHNLSMRWNNSLVKRGARPSGIFSIEGELSNNSYERAKQEVAEQMSGAENAGKPFILEGGAKFIETSKTPKDMDFDKSLQAAAIQIALVYSYPLPLLTTNAATFNNVATAYEMLYENVAIPTLKTFIDKFNQWLSPRYGDNIKIVLDEESIPALEGKRDRKMDRQIRAVKGSIITINEAREHLGFDALLDENADKVMIAQTLSTLDEVDADVQQGDNPVSDEDLDKNLKSMGYTAEEIKGMKGE